MEQEGARLVLANPDLRPEMKAALVGKAVGDEVTVELPHLHDEGEGEDHEDHVDRYRGHGDGGEVGVDLEDDARLHLRHRDPVPGPSVVLMGLPPSPSSWRCGSSTVTVGPRPPCATRAAFSARPEVRVGEDEPGGPRCCHPRSARRPGGPPLDVDDGHVVRRRAPSPAGRSGGSSVRVTLSRRDGGGRPGGGRAAGGPRGRRRHPAGGAPGASRRGWSRRAPGSSSANPDLRPEMKAALVGKAGRGTR